MLKNIALILMLLTFSCAGVSHAETPDTPPIPPTVRHLTLPSMPSPSDDPSFMRLLGNLEVTHPLPIIIGQHAPPTIMLEQDIDEDSVKAFGKSLDKLAERKPKEIRVIISSGGGQTDAGLALAKMIERFPANVTCLADGEVGSMAFAVFESCDVRQMTARSALMGHRSSANMSGNMTEEDLRSAADSVHATSLAVAQMTCAKSKVKVEEFLKRTEGSKQWWITPDDALKFGFVDAVVPKVIW